MDKNLEIIEDLLDEEGSLEDESNNEIENTRTTDLRENAIEWYNGRDIITVTLSQRKYINKIMKYAEKYPEDVKIEKINEDGTILAHIPLSYLKIQKPRTMSEEDKKKAKERLLKYHKNKKNN